eukprot:scaffold127434_cov57-Phaeocystis_antarctica.AAC.2
MATGRPGRPGCGPRSGLTRPSLGPGTTYTVLSARRPRRVVRGLGRAFLYLSIYLSVSPRGFPTPSRPRASVIRTSDHTVVV